MMHLFSSVMLFASSVSLLTTAAEERFSWPHWDGPERSGVSAEKDWNSAGKEAPLWELEVGLGYSTVSVQDGRLYTMGYDKEAGLDSVWCLDAATGEKIWTHTYESAIWDRAHEGGTVNTPSIDGEVVYSLNREGNLFCFEAATGEIRWHTFLKPEDNPYELEYPTWGFSASPLVLGDRIFLNCGRVLAIDKKSGDVLWHSKDYGHAYGTPATLELRGKQALALLNDKGLAVVSREDGSELYFHEFTGTNRGVNAATPIVLGDAVFISSGRLPGCALVALGEDGVIPIWDNREMVNSFSGCVRMDGHLYGFDRAILKCIDLEGQSKWEERGIGNGAVTGADDRILAMTAEGELIVAQAKPDAYEELSRAKVFDDGGKYWTKPILVNGIIYCRSSRGGLVARDHRGEAGGD